jgi:hypothetical protein
VTLKITGANKPAGQFLVNYGVTDALSAFPLHSLVSNMTATINNNTVSMNVQDTLPLLLRMLDSEEMAKYECMTPTTLDYLSRLPRRRGPAGVLHRRPTATRRKKRPVLFCPGAD